MNLTIAIDLDRVLEQVFALCALTHVTEIDTTRRVPGIEDRPALMQTAINACAELIYNFGACVTGTNIGELPGENGDCIATISLQLPDARSADTIRPVLESALAATVTSIVYAGVNSDVSRRYAEAANTTLATLRLSLTTRTDKPGAITPAA